MATGVIVLLSLTVVALLSGIVAIGIQKYNTPHITHYEFTDKQILKFIAEQNDGLCTPEMLAKASSLTKKEAKARLSKMMYRGILNISHSNSFKSFYSLKFTIKKGPYPKLSSDPFLAVSDLMLLFRHFDYRLTIQDICIATNLPIEVIIQEMKYFIKEKIIDQVTQYASDSVSEKTKFYVLLDPYRSDPEKISKQQASLDLNVKKMYERMVSGKRPR